MRASKYTEDNSEVIEAYYQIYLYNLEEGLIELYEVEAFLELLEEEESYLECAGVFKAITNYKAILEERFSEMIMDISGDENTE